MEKNENRWQDLLTSAASICFDQFWAEGCKGSKIYSDDQRVITCKECLGKMKKEE